MGANRSREIYESVELLQMAGTCGRQESGDGALSAVVARSEHDLPPLNGGPERALGDVVRRLDTLLVHEGKEVRKMQEQRAREVPHVIVGGVDGTARQCEEFLLKRQHLRDQLLARERRATGVRIAPEAMPQTEQAFLQGQGLAAKARGRRRLRELLRAEEISREVRPTELTLVGRVGQITGQPIAPENSCERGTEQPVQHVRAARRRNLI